MICEGIAMVQKTESKVIVLFKDNFFLDLHERLDLLHTAASEGRLHTLTTLSPEEVLEWLQDLSFTIEETLHEITLDHESPGNVVQLLDRPEFKSRLLS
jgi:hypothetical protein